MTLGFEAGKALEAISRSMEYRGFQYTLEEDGRGWRWTVALGSPPEVKSGRAIAKGNAILKVWAAIYRTLGSRQFRRLRSGRPTP
jgi:hypothetical protein